MYWPQNLSIVDVQCDSDKLNIHSSHHPGYWMAIEVLVLLQRIMVI